MGLQGFTSPLPSRQPAIEARNLTKEYDDLIAVDGLDMNVAQGEIFGLLGPNGAGKTTTAGMFTTRVIPTGGKAIVGGIDVVADPATAKRLIGVVPQTNTLDRSLDVSQNLYFHGRFFGMRAAEARTESDRLLQQFRLNDRRSAAVTALSGGMAQRLMLARAVMHRPSVLFLDEPTAGLDPQSRLALWDILRDLHSEGQTVLLTTHYMDEADQLCDRVAIIDEGRLVALDSPIALKQSVGVDATVTINADGDLDSLAKLLTERIPAAVEAAIVDQSIRLTVQNTAGLIPAVVQTAEQAEITLTDISVADTTLETVFISLTGKELRE